MKAVMEHLMLAAMWSGYCALHSFLISIRFTNLMTRVLKNNYAFNRLGYVIISIVLLVPLIRFEAQFNDPIIFAYGFPLSLLRYLLVAGSLLMFFWAFFFEYDPWSFFGFRQILDGGKTTRKPASGNLRKTGLLGMTRHPMYFALMVSMWCQTFRVSDIVVNIVLTAYIIIGTRLEENKLVMEFGDAYHTYQQEVPMLIPLSSTILRVPRRFVRYQTQR